MGVELMERLEATQTYDRTTEDVGNIVELAHVNIWVKEPHLGHLFYVCGLGLTRDPFGVTGISSMWVNVGRSQFHLPWGEAPRMQATTGLVLPDLDVLRKNLTAVQKLLAGTRFGFETVGDRVDVTCPWGNRFRCHAPDVERFGITQVGIPYVEFYSKPDGLARIVRFYQEVVGTQAGVAEDETGEYACVQAGPEQRIVYRETGSYEREFWGHQIQIALADFSGPYAKLKKLGLITRGDEPASIPVRGRGGRRHRRGAVHDPARNAEHASSAFRAASHHSRSSIDNTDLVQGGETQPTVMMRRDVRRPAATLTEPDRPQPARAAGRPKCWRISSPRLRIEEIDEATRVDEDVVGHDRGLLRVPAGGCSGRRPSAAKDPQCRRSAVLHGTRRG